MDSAPSFPEPVSPDSLRAAQRKRRWIAAATVLWFVAVLVATYAFLSFEFRPGVPVIAPATWPQDSALAHVPGRTTLVLFAHPYCVCTKASLDELSVILSRASGVQAYAVFVRLPGFSDEEMRGESWGKAGRIPGLVRLIDEGGVETRRFGAATSGVTVLYDAGGQLVFDGGITRSRGQVGVNEGRLAVESALHGKPALRRTRTYGCALFDAELPASGIPRAGA